MFFHFQSILEPILSMLTGTIFFWAHFRREVLFAGLDSGLDWTLDSGLDSGLDSKVL